jgi:hypothetical protein
MIQIKRFSLSDTDGFNKFMETQRPRGEKGIICNTEGLFIFYEKGYPMDKYDKLASLRFQLGEHRERIMHTTKEILIAEEQAKLEKKEKEGDKKKEYELRKYLEDSETVISAKKKMNQLEQAAEKAILEMIKEIENE